MAERSSTISGALLLTPTLCIVALRYGLPRINEVISNDIIIEISIHTIAIIFGLVMFSRYRVVEDHRSATIKRLRKSYSQEDKGLWDKSEIAIKKLEEQSSEQLKGRKGALIQAKMSGNIGSLNAESSEDEVDANEEIEVVTHHKNIGTIIDEAIIGENKSESSKSFLSKKLEKSALKRLEKKRLKAAKKEIKKLNSKTKVKGYTQSDENQWDVSSKTQLTPTVASCKECGTLNNSNNPYCTSCGTYLS